MERSLERRILLRSLILSAVLTALIAALLLTKGATGAFVLLFPALWLTSTFFSSNVATSDSGPENLIRIVLAGSLLNIILYTTVFFLISRYWYSRKLPKQVPSE
jgi:hypothetical protein